MICADVRVRLFDYLDRDLAPYERQALDEHLIGCVECQRELALLTAIDSALDHQPVLEPPQGFCARVMTSLPRRRQFGFDPAWLLLLIPMVSLGCWLSRGPAGRWSDALAQRLSALDLGRLLTLALDPRPARLVICGFAIVALAAVSVASFAAIGWRMLRD